MYSNSFNYSNPSSKSVLDEHGLTKQILMTLIYDPKFEDVRFISWNGTELVNKNILPENCKTCKNIVVTKNIIQKFIDYENNSLRKNISSKNEIIIFII